MLDVAIAKIAPPLPAVKKGLARYPLDQIQAGETWLFKYDDNYDPVLVRNAISQRSKYRGRSAKFTTKVVDEGLLVARLLDKE